VVAGFLAAAGYPSAKEKFQSPAGLPMAGTIELGVHVWHYVILVLFNSAIWVTSSCPRKLIYLFIPPAHLLENTHMLKEEGTW
jgi:hypothetical protein